MVQESCTIGFCGFTLANMEGAVALDPGTWDPCRNGLDDDGDGFVDLQDPGCRDANDSSETHARPGDVLVSNYDSGAVSVFDPITTRLAAVMDSATANAWDIEINADGEVLLAGWGSGSLLEIDLELGTASPLSSGGLLTYPTGIARSGIGEIFLAEEVGGTLLKVHPVTGAQTLITSDAVNFVQIKDLVFEPGGDLLVSTRFAGIHRVDPSTGSIITTFASDDARQLDVDLLGDAIYADRGAVDAPMSLDLDTGISTPLLSTPTLPAIRGVLQEPSGRVIATDRDTGEIVRVDAAGDTATTLNIGREDVGMYYMSAIPAAAELTTTLTDSLVIDGGTPASRTSAIDSSSPPW